MHRTMTTTILFALAGTAWGATAFAGAPATETVFVADGAARCVRHEGAEWTVDVGFLECGGSGNFLFAERLLGPGDFRVRARLTIVGLARSAASFVLGSSHFGFEGGSGQMFTEGPLLGRNSLGPPVVREGEPFEIEAIRQGDVLRVLVDGKEVHRAQTDPKLVLHVGLRPWRSTMRVEQFSARGHLIPAPKPPLAFCAKKAARSLATPQSLSTTKSLRRTFLRSIFTVTRPVSR